MNKQLKIILGDKKAKYSIEAVDNKILFIPIKNNKKLNLKSSKSGVAVDGKITTKEEYNNHIDNSQVVIQFNKIRSIDSLMNLLEFLKQYMTENHNKEVIKSIKKEVKRYPYSAFSRPKIERDNC